MSDSENPAGSPSAVLVPTEQRQITLMEGDEVVAARVDPDMIYLPLRVLCDNLGIGYSAQFARLKRDEVLAEALRRLKIQTAGGVQTMQCLELETVPLWLAMIEPSRVREDLRDKLRLYKRWVRRRVWEAFAHETGLAGALEGSRAPVPASPDAQSLIHIAQMAEAIATMARQQLAFEQNVDTRLVTLDAHVAALAEGQQTISGRLDQAAAVVGSLLRRVDSIEGVVRGGEVISDAQAAEISALVKAIAAELTEKVKAAGTTGRNPYQAVFGELYRRFRVSSYHNIPQRRFNEVMTWLREYQETLTRAQQSEWGPWIDQLFRAR
jgi:hypothetical protein